MKIFNIRRKRNKSFLEKEVEIIFKIINKCCFNIIIKKQLKYENYEWLIIKIITQIKIINLAINSIKTIQLWLLI